MAFFTSKVLAAILAGGTVSLGALGLAYSGGVTLDGAEKTVQDLGQKIAKFDDNEQALVAKISEVKLAAETKLTEANTNISTLNNKVSNLNTQITTLSNDKAVLTAKVAELEEDVNSLSREIASLKETLKAEQGNHAKTQAALDAKTTEYNTKVAELNTANGKLNEANAKIASYEALAREAVERAKVADKKVTELEGEINKANADVAAHGAAVNEVKEDTAEDVPMTEADLADVDTSIDVEVTPVAENK
ncbi:hypothetical protein GKZ89_14035 [Bacillus mangrovi]|uniref:Uncharacterized protein n=1 Tax=Metabacillus mangrovi TaxID=1491830 RepID=A0A7X2S764_9BACI|nr:hypothetical protein [Metabacillus mangrovi]MTH54520.1 hypothetical protein [Metabacillus mangrovi]